MIEEIINKMFQIAGHDVTFDDIKDREDSWYTEWTMTREQNEEWVEWGIKYIKKKKRWSIPFCKREMSMIDLMYGLKLKQ
jgi:hypothetical protein